MFGVVAALLDTADGDIAEIPMPNVRGELLRQVGPVHLTTSQHSRRVVRVVTTCR